MFGMSICGCWNLRKQRHAQHERSRNGKRKAESKHQQQQYSNGDLPLTTTENETKQQLSRQLVPPIPSSSVPQKKVSFSWNANQSNNRCLHKNSYDYIDADEEGDARRRRNSTDDNNEDTEADGYSKLDDNHSQHRYDYPTFNLAATKRERLLMRRTAEESFYASASQTYSAGSEDPYSSIVSIGGADRLAGDESSSTYEPGYSRITNNRQQPRKDVSNSNKHNEKCSPLDTLYAKINRSSSSHKFDPNQPSTSNQANTLLLNSTRRHHRLFTDSAPNENDNNQEMESGSGSMVSSQPSYRYLTVRESADIVRERIRRREEEQEEAAAARRIGENLGNVLPDASSLPRAAGNGPAEHYYSEINEYESVGGDSIYNASTIATLDNGRGVNDLGNNNDNRRSHDVAKPSTSSSFANNDGSAIPIQSAGCSTSTSFDTLRILLSPNSNHPEPPRPPTSPIPKPQPAPKSQSSPLPTYRRPVIMMPQKPPPPSSSMSQSVSTQQHHEQKLINRMSVPPAIRPNKIASNSTTTNDHLLLAQSHPHQNRSPSTRDLQGHIRSVFQPLWHNGKPLLGMGGSGAKKQQRQQQTEQKHIPADGRIGTENSHGQSSSSQAVELGTGNNNGVVSDGHLSRELFVEVKTQTPPVPPSRIPVMLLRTRTPSPARSSSTGTMLKEWGTGNNTSREAQNRQQAEPKQQQQMSSSESLAKTAAFTNCGKKDIPPHKRTPMSTSVTTTAALAPLPLQVGHDYVSPIDLSNQRAWPLS